ncbi:hypothetical protein [Streptomyces sp. NPDC059783]|uniref:hypothetical protein n=1 Tax=Streptomyces sp. NPDC059783 TaxID=3346944 RepID=UPI00364CF374
MSENPRPSDVTDGPIHTWFSLSYSNYLVLHRTLLQSMPAEWQTQFVALLGELDTAFEHVPQAGQYEVTPGQRMTLNDMTDSQLYTAGVTVEGDSEDGPGPETRYHRISDGAEMHGSEYGFIPSADPVPHYNRGRTYIAPNLHSCDNCDGVDPQTCLTATKES